MLIQESVELHPTAEVDDWYLRQSRISLILHTWLIIVSRYDYS